MAEPVTKLPVKTEAEAAVPASMRTILQPIEGLRREVEHLLDEFDRGIWRNPFRRSMFDLEPIWRRELRWAEAPAVDIVEKDGAYEIAAEMPGMTDRDIEVKLSDGALMIKGEKKEAKEEKKREYYLSERHYGAFERCFGLPQGVDASKIEATMKNGVLTVTLPKTAEAQKKSKAITVKAA